MDMAACSLQEMSPGKRGIVQELTAEGPLRFRLYALGFTPGAPVEVCPYSSAEGLNVRLRGSSLILDAQTAKCIKCLPVSTKETLTTLGLCSR